MVFGAHPDDLEIGMGGTISKFTELGYDVTLVVSTLPNFVESDKKEERKLEAISSAKILGCKHIEILDLSTDDMTYGRNLVSLLDSLINKYKPKTVFTHWFGDSHQDHQFLTKSVISSCRDIDNLCMYENTIPGGLTEHSFRPQLYVDITNTLELKINALKCFKSQFQRCGPLWIDALIGRSRYRGYQIHSRYAEAFEIIKLTKW